MPVGAGAANGRLVSYEARDLPVAERCPRTRYESAVMDLVIFLPLIIIMGAFMWFASRRQRKAMQATIDLHESLRVGDRVHTTSGLQATITGITRRHRRPGDRPRRGDHLDEAGRPRPHRAGDPGDRGVGARFVVACGRRCTEITESDADRLTKD